MQSQQSLTKLRDLVGYRSSSPAQPLPSEHLQDAEIHHDVVMQDTYNAVPAPPSLQAPTPFTEHAAAIEERNGDIEVRAVNNDGKRESTIVLCGVKNIFQLQLPNMPKGYIARLVLDRSHVTIAIVKKPLEVLGGITFRVFSTQQFVEIVFCAISPEYQAKGYGAHLMAHLKDYVKATTPGVYDFITYADNKAIPWFKRQGFTTEVTLPPRRWQGYIKDYDGSTRMQCTMLPKIRYLQARRMLALQKDIVNAKIAAVSRSFKVHAPPAQWQSGLQKIDPLSIPAIRDAGWSPEMDEASREPPHSTEHVHMARLLGDLSHDSSAWPFAEPVDKTQVPDYYDVIKEPICLADIQKKLEEDKYECMKDMVADVKLMLRNCRTFNPPKSVYFRAAGKLEKLMWAKLRETGEFAYLESEFPKN